MMSRTQVTLDPEEHRLARRRASELGVSFAEYIRRLVRDDVGGSARPAADISAIFGLADSGGADIATHKDDYIGEALDAAHPRR